MKIKLLSLAKKLASLDERDRGTVLSFLDLDQRDQGYIVGIMHAYEEQDTAGVNQKLKTLDKPKKVATKAKKVSKTKTKKVATTQKESKKVSKPKVKRVARKANGSKEPPALKDECRKLIWTSIQEKQKDGGFSHQSILLAEPVRSQIKHFHPKDGVTGKDYLEELVEQGKIKPAKKRHHFSLS